MGFNSSYRFYKVADECEIINNERIFVQIGDLNIVILCIDNEYYAIGDICTHDGGPLGDGEIIENQIVCPRHGARFDLRTGQALTLPAIKNIPSYPVRVLNESIEVGIPK